MPENALHPVSIHTAERHLGLEAEVDVNEIFTDFQTPAGAEEEQFRRTDRNCLQV